MAEGLDWFREVIRLLFRAARNDLAQIGFSSFQLPSVMPGFIRLRASAERNPPKLTK